ncbi:MAG: endo-1,4-beta-xylanase, partial [Candidatus Nanohaloarchaea archaeon]
MANLRDIAEEKGLTLGAAANRSDMEDSRYRELLRREFNLLSFEEDLKWEYIHPE